MRVLGTTPLSSRLDTAWAAANHKWQQQSYPTCLLTNSLEKPELPNSSIRCFCWNSHPERHVNYMQLSFVAETVLQLTFSPSHKFNMWYMKSTCSFQQSPARDDQPIRLLTRTFWRALQCQTLVSSPHIMHCQSSKGSTVYSFSTAFLSLASFLIKSVSYLAFTLKWESLHVK